MTTPEGCMTTPEGRMTTPEGQSDGADRLPIAILIIPQ